MRALFVFSGALTAAALSGCGGETCADGSTPVDGECPCADADGYPSDFGGECPTDCPDPQVLDPDGSGECGYTCWDGSWAQYEEDCPMPPLDPVAVGFEFDGAIVDGDLAGFLAPDGQGGTVEIPPTFLVTFADLDYFSAQSAEARQGHFCEAYALVADAFGETGLSVDGNDIVWLEWEMTLSLSPQVWAGDFDTACAYMLDEEVWGFEGEDLLNAFTGFRFGFGVGPMTDYLSEAWSQETLDMIGSSMFAEHIAINDASGAWIAYDWTTGIAFEINDDGSLPTETDPDTGDEILIAIDLTDATDMPNAYVRSFAYWYQDFEPFLDLTNLADGAPTATR